MAQIDKLIEIMIQRGGQRAILAGGQHAILYIGGNEFRSGIIDTARLERILAEISPQGLPSRDKTTTFVYASPHGGVEVTCDHPASGWRLRIEAPSGASTAAVSI